MAGNRNAEHPSRRPGSRRNRPSGHAERLAALTVREREVLVHVAAGLS
ncbi:hypothetical protein ICJ52_25935, partial [Streptomyces sp. KD18]|nr:hypothetical protein [Streptomyces sp. KD18]